MTNFETTVADQTVKEMDVEEFDLAILGGRTGSTSPLGPFQVPSVDSKSKSRNTRSHS
jgi:hypothetical protein